ncbi:MAG TPA: GPP34 family phosphoprotein [Capillimicrobium sp.]
MLIAEELLLIALDDASGKEALSSSGYGMLDYALAGALLLDLSLAEALEVRDGKVQATGASADPLLADALAAVRESGKPRAAKHWVQRLPKALKPMRARIAERLVEAGVLREERSKVLGLFSRTRYPEADPAPERELRARLEQTLVTGADPDPRTALLVSLLVPLDLVGKVVPKEAHRHARRRAKEVADQGVVGTGLERVVQDMQAAVMVSVIAATTTTAATSGSN